VTTLQDPAPVMAKRDGAGPAFEQFLAPYREALLHVCRRHLRNHEDVQDALQDTLLAAWLHFDLVQRVHAPLCLLREIAINKCRDLLRKHRRRQMLPLDARPEPATDADRGLADAVGSADRQVVLRELRRSIDRLSPSLRLVARLRYLDGLAYLDIAARLGVSEGTIKSRLHRARDRLRHSRGVRVLADHNDQARRRESCVA
jgi:RNA polymerase sigma-70 factor (ECF subfamily)